MNEQEKLWVEEARQGSQEAFNYLVEAYHRPVFNLTYRMLSDPQEAEDAAQETFLRAYSRLQQYNPQHKFSTWIFSIANHHCIDRLRKRRYRFVSIEDNPVLENMAGNALQPERNALDSELGDEIQSLLSNIDPDYRTPLVLRYWEDYSYEEIATAMELSISAVKSRLFRARKQMAELYRTQEMVNTPPLQERSEPKAKQDSAFIRGVPPALQTAMVGI